MCGVKSMQFKIGDMVVRKSYRRDILFRIIRIDQSANGEPVAVLHGDEVRLIADAYLTDLEMVREAERQMRKREEESRMKESLDLLRQDYKLLHNKHEYRATNQYNNQQQYFHMPGRVLHLDGDSAYLKNVWRSMKRSGFLYTAFIVMKKMSSVIEELIDEYRPDLLVITGHDAYSKQKGDINNLDAYRHSKDFIETVQKARKKFPILISLSFLPAHASPILNH